MIDRPHEKNKSGLCGWYRHEQALMDQIKNSLSFLQNALDTLNTRDFRKTLYSLTGSLCGLLIAGCELTSLFNLYAYNKESSEAIFHIIKNAMKGHDYYAQCRFFSNQSCFSSRRWSACAASTLITSMHHAEETLVMDMLENEIPISKINPFLYFSLGAASLSSLIYHLKNMFYSREVDQNKLQWKTQLDGAAIAVIKKTCAQLHLVVNRDTTNIGLQNQLTSALASLECHRERRHTFLLFKSDKGDNTGLQLLLQNDGPCDLVGPILTAAGLGAYY